MTNNTPKAIHLKDYTPPSYLIQTVDLYFDLQEQHTKVHSRLAMVRQKGIAKDEPLILNGEHLTLEKIQLDGRVLAADAYQLTDETLTLFHLPDAFILEIVTLIKPHENTALEGLYQSNGNYCTQCEAHGFRRITYFLDRPDVMAIYTTTIEADKKRYPVLLSNGNLIASGDKDQGRHYVTWKDPFKKPCYLFALVAGDLAVVEDNFITCSKRKVILKIYVEKGNEDKCSHAMVSLKKAMQWDGQAFGREYDLDIFMIVAVSDFNMGAMENKGLNIFNAKYILARPDTATDTDFGHIEGVVGHEYFHNWTGNRITCRDWFQLSLKEGLTVFRDQQFSGDMNSPVVERISNVRALRSVQFVEDAGPLAHPVRPESYIEMNNFYTATVYEKGAELIRMMHTLLGPDKFRKGMDLYFERHDGQAVTCDNFVQAMQDASDIDLTQFRLWYSQAGTPQLEITQEYNAQQKIYKLMVKQSCPSTPGQAQKNPLHIPLKMALFSAQGQQLELQLADKSEKTKEKVLAITQAEQAFTFINIAEHPVPSLLRNFSAPVKLKVNLSLQQLIFLMVHDTDHFNRWEASQQIATKIMLNLVADYQQGKPLSLQADFIEAVRQLLTAKHIDNALIAQILILPSEVYLGEMMSIIDVEAIVTVRRFMREQIALRLKMELMEVYHANMDTHYHFTAEAVGKRSLKNVCLQYLMLTPDELSEGLALQQFEQSDNMTDEIAAFQALAHADTVHRQTAIDNFYQKWQHNPLVVDKWLMVQATADLDDTLDNIKGLLKHPAFVNTNPNKVRALIGAFGSGNFNRFHAKSGEGYAFLAEQVITLNQINPQVAARLVEPLTRWKRYDEQRQGLLKAQLKRILASPNLSKDVYELVSKSNPS